jgi:hypothetical protein
MQNFSKKGSLLAHIKRIGACRLARFWRQQPPHNPEPELSRPRTSLDLNNKMEFVIDVDGKEGREQEPTETADALEGSDRDFELEEKLEEIRADCNEHEKMIIGGVIIPSKKLWERLFDRAID